MRTKRIKLYSFKELSIEAQKRAVISAGFKVVNKSISLTNLDLMALNESEYLKGGTIYTEK